MKNCSLKHEAKTAVGNLGFSTFSATLATASTPPRLTLRRRRVKNGVQRRTTLP